MAYSARFKALEAMLSRSEVRSEAPQGPVSDYFGTDVFDSGKMRKYLPAEVVDSLDDAVRCGRRIDRGLADKVAGAMKEWAMEHGATHYAHWFQPLTDSTAEKHDAFADPVWGENRCIEKFSGSLLIQQEPDASSFPTGGLRNTFEARGYTAWDPSSPAFIIDDTLCVPSIFISYTGEALDYKSPLLKSVACLDKAATAMAGLFEEGVQKVVVNLGWEQEYFLVDEALYNARPDLVQTGRTLMGHTAAKDQQLDDHYFGVIPKRVVEYMKDVETAAFRLGIPLKTRHNEAAPNQYECAPVYEEANIAIDHNSLLMTVMKSVARRHHLKVLLHEKPFAGVNGSGKHCNWSIATQSGHNLLAPGKTPQENLEFTAFFVCVLKAAWRRNPMIMASVATQPNRHRLGGGEAPPSVLSVFCGSAVSRMLDEFGGESLNQNPRTLKENTDRNRTSPFAFNGNRFEFRAAGSSANCAMPLLVINTAVTEQLVAFKADVDALMAEGTGRDEAIRKVICRYIEESAPVRFEGNGYSQEWLEEASRRGLKRITSITQAIAEYIDPDNVEMFGRFGVFTPGELESRYGIKNETFLKKLQIEARVIGDMALNHIIPVAVAYQNTLLENVRGLKETYPDTYQKMAEYSLSTIGKISEHVNAIRADVDALVETRKKWNHVEDIIERARGYEDEVAPLLDAIRRRADELEMLVDDSCWPLPKYRELFQI